VVQRKEKGGIKGGPRLDKYSRFCGGVKGRWVFISVENQNGGEQEMECIKGEA